MIELILPPCAEVASTREDVDVPLHAEEEAALGRAVEKRRREFVTARACARQALRSLGRPASPVPSGEKGEPLWPAGVVGSITHCAGYRACAVGRSEELASIGIDAEVAQPLPAGLLADIALPEERQWIAAAAREQAEVPWDRLLFSIKESVYKAWFPLAKRWLGFEDAHVWIDAHGGRFEARLLVEGPLLDGRQLRRLPGRWMARDGLLFAAIALPRVPAAADAGTWSGAATSEKWALDRR